MPTIEARAAVAERDLTRTRRGRRSQRALGCTPPCAHPRRRSTTCPKQATQRCGPSGTPARRDSRRATMDAGPNVKVLTSTEHAEALNIWLRERLDGSVPGFRTIVTHAGPGLKVTR